MKVLIFDVDDTLYSQIIPFEKAYKKLFDKVDIDIEKLYELSRKYSDEKFEDSRSGKMSMDDYHVYRFSKALEHFSKNIDYATALQFQKLYAENQKSIQVSEELQNFLDFAVRENMKLAVITNGPSIHQWNKVRVLNLEKWFSKEKIFVSYDVGFNKPDRRIFAHVADKLSLKENDEIYYVGDSFENDIVGATNYGWRAIWLNRRKKNPVKKVANYIEVNGDKQLIKLLYKIIKTN